jgi:hypothetical protein
MWSWSQFAFIEFWSSAPKNPIKTVRQYDESFEHNLPLPFVSNGELMYTLEGPLMYIGVLRRLVELDENDHKAISKDGSDFLRLIVDHAQLFERHWRKMVVDIRTGCLNRNILLPENAKKLYLSVSMPRPVLAVKLDTAFRDLGFHMKVLGKDIHIKSYAEKKIRKHTAKRKMSFPQTSLGSSGIAAISLGDEIKPNTSSRPGTLSPTGRVMKKAETISNCESPSCVQNHSKKMTRQEALIMAATVGDKAAKALREKENDMSSRGISMRSRGLERRGSDTDIFKVTTAPQLKKIEYDLNAESRTSYFELVELGERFICPFAACGASFTSRDAAFAHLKTHEQKRRMYANTPLSDSHLNFYWPNDVPWRSEEYTMRQLPPGSIPCTEKGCQEVFMSRHRLQYHLRWVHKSTAKLSASQLFFSFSGDFIAVPPSPPPIYAPIDFCTLHLNLNPNCDECLKFLSNGSLPKQPYKFYDMLQINFKKRDGVGGICNLNREFIDKGVYFSQGKKILMGKPIAFMKDAKHDGWMAVNKFINIEKAKSLKLCVPKDPDMTYELILDDGSFMPLWIKLVDVKSTFFLMESTKDEFNFKLRTGEIPKENVYFIRTQRLPSAQPKSVGPLPTLPTERVMTVVDP